MRLSFCLLLFYLTTLSIAKIIYFQVTWVIHNEMKESTLDSFQLTYWHFSGGTKKNHAELQNNHDV